MNFPTPRVLGGNDDVSSRQWITVAHLVGVGAAFQFDGESLSIGQIDDLFRDPVTLGDDALILEAVDIDTQLCQGETVHRTDGAFEQPRHLQDKIRIVDAGARV